MPWRRNFLPRSTDLRKLDETSPVFLIRGRISWQGMSRFLEIEEQYYLPVDRETRDVLRFVDLTRKTFNYTAIFRYPDWDTWRNFDQIYAEAWMRVHGSRSVEEAQQQIEELEDEMNSYLEDDERQLLLELSGNGWASGVEVE